MMQNKTQKKKKKKKWQSNLSIKKLDEKKKTSKLIIGWSRTHIISVLVVLNLQLIYLRFNDNHQEVAMIIN